MRKLYVTPREIHDAHRHHFSPHITTHWLGLIPSSELEHLKRWRSLDCPVAVSTEFAGESSQELWENHPHVWVLPHPVWQGTHPVAMAANYPENENNAPWGLTAEKKDLGNRLPSPGTLAVALPGWGSSQEPGARAPESTGIDCLVLGGMGVLPSDTILQVHRKLAVVHPAFRMRPLR